MVDGNKMVGQFFLSRLTGEDIDFIAEALDMLYEKKKQLLNPWNPSFIALEELRKRVMNPGKSTK
jgi:ribosomal 50S subunit-associated protein YjgA (DUF615 family)